MVVVESPRCLSRQPAEQLWCRGRAQHWLGRLRSSGVQGEKNHSLYPSPKYHSIKMNINASLMFCERASLGVSMWKSSHLSHLCCSDDWSILHSYAKNQTWAWAKWHWWARWHETVAHLHNLIQNALFHGHWVLALSLYWNRIFFLNLFSSHLHSWCWVLLFWPPVSARSSWNPSKPISALPPLCLASAHVHFSAVVCIETWIFDLGLYLSPQNSGYACFPL